MKLFLWLSIFFNIFLYADNKVIYLISTPRSMSTFLLKMVDARGDFKVYSEPFSPIYFRKKAKWFSSLSFDNSNFFTPSSFGEEIEKEKKIHNIFIKDISTFLLPYLSEIENFIKDENTYFVFLIRNPHEEIISWYKKFKFNFGFNPRSADLYKIYTTIKSKKKDRVKILFTEDLMENTELSMQQLCSYIDLPYKSSMIKNLPILTTQEAKKRWSDPFRFYSYIHKVTLESTHVISDSKVYSVDKNGSPSFKELNIFSRKAAKKIYEKEKTFYDKFKAHTEDHLISDTIEVD